MLPKWDQISVWCILSLGTPPIVSKITDKNKKCTAETIYNTFTCTSKKFRAGYEGGGGGRVGHVPSTLSYFKVL